MQKKKVLLMTKLIIVIAMAFIALGAFKVMAAEGIEKVVSETTVLNWKNEIIDYELDITDFRIIYTVAEYKIEHYKEKLNGEYELVEDDTEEKSGVVGEYGEYEPNEYVGFVYNPDLTEPEDKAILIDGDLVIKLYYERRKDLSYTVNHYYQDAPGLFEQRTYNNQVYGDTISDEDVELIVKNWYRYGRTENTPLVINIENNVIDVYYYKSNVAFTKTSKAYSGIDNSVISTSAEFIHVGDYIVYTIKIQNLGLAAEEDIVVTVSDVLDLRLLEYISSNSYGKGSIQESNISGGTKKEIKWSGSLASMEEATIDIRVRINEVPEDPDGFVIGKNIAYTKIDGQTGPDVEDEEEYKVGKANIVGEKTSVAYGRDGMPVSGNELLEEDTIIYTITLQNLGNEKGQAKITDPILIGALDYVGATPSKGTIGYNPATGVLTWNVEIESAETVYITIETKVKLLDDEIEIHKNIAGLEVNGEDEGDIPDEEEYYVRKPRMVTTKTSIVYDYTGAVVSKSGSPTTIHEKDTIKYIITLKNEGPNSELVSIEDTIQIGVLDYVEKTESLGTTDYNPATGVLKWEGNIPGHTTVTIEIIVQAKNVAAGASYTIGKNVVNLAINEIPKDPFEDPYEYIVAKTDVTVAKSSTLRDYLGEFITDTNNCHEGDTITYTITATNNGIAQEKGLVITDDIRIGLNYVSSSANVGANPVWNAGTGRVTWTGDLLAGQTVTITITATVKPLPAGTTELHIGQNTVNIKANGTDRPEIKDPRDYWVRKPNVITEKSSVAYSAKDGTPIPSTAMFIHEGDTIIYTITVHNAGAIREKGLKIVDPINTVLLEFIDVDANIGTAEWKSALNRVEWEGTLLPGQTATITIETKVRETTSEQGYPIDRNIASIKVNGGEEKPVPDPNEYVVGKVALNVIKTSKVLDYTGAEVIKTSPVTKIHEGDTIIYTIMVQNDGDETAHIIIEDQLQIGAVTYVGYEASTGIVDWRPATGLFVWVVDVGPGGTESLKITVKAKDVASGTSCSITNNVAKLEVNEDEEEPITDPDEYIVEKTIINVVKSSTLMDYLGEYITDTNDCHEGDIITYTITATNNGGLPEKGIVLTDDINIAGLTYVSSSSNKTPNPAWNAGTGRLTWIGDLAPGESVTITITVEVKSLPTGVTELRIGQNTVNIKANGVDRPEIKDPRDYWVRKSNVIVEKTSVAYKGKDETPIPGSAEYIHEGDAIIYTITVTNAGAIREKGIIVEDPINTALLEDIVVNADIGIAIWSGAQNKVIWGGTLLPGQTATITIEVKVKETSGNKGYPIDKNIVNVRVNGEDKDPVEDPEEYVVGKVTLTKNKTSKVLDYTGAEVTKTPPVTKIHEGDTIIYTITIGNSGDETANIVLEDELQAGAVTYVSATASMGGDPVWAAGKVRWEGAIPEDSSVTITITVKAKDVASGTNYTIENNVAKLEVNGEEKDPIEDPDEYIVEKTIINVVKSSTLQDYLGDYITDTNDCHEGDTITYTITATNNGSLPEKGVVLTDDINIAGLTYVSSSSNRLPNPTYNTGTGRLTWTGDLAPGASVTITITVKVKPLPAGVTELHIGQNTVDIKANGVDKPSVKDPRDYWVRKSNILAEKSSVAYKGTDGSIIPSTAQFIHEGDTIIYTIKITNAGAIRDKGIIVCDPINITLLELIDYDADIGTPSWNNTLNRVEWEGTLLPGQTATITIEVKIRESDRTEGYKVDRNVATITINGGEEEEVIDPKEYTVGKLVINAIKTSKAFDYTGAEIPEVGNATTIHEGDTITYYIEILNDGDEPADIKIEDPIQTSVVTHISSSSSKGANPAYNSGTGKVTWQGTLQPGENVLIEIIVKALPVPYGEASITIQKNIASLEANDDPAKDVEDNKEFYIVVKSNVSVVKSSTLRDAFGDYITDTNDCHEGDTITYTITVKNNATIYEKGVVVTDDVNVAALSVNTPTSGGKGNINWNGATGRLTWTGDLAPGETVTITITATVKSLPTGVTSLQIGQNTVNYKVNGEDQTPEKDPRDYWVRKSNIFTEKTSKAYAAGTGLEILAPNFVHEGDTIVYTITVRNDGAIREKNILIIDPLVNTTYIQRVSESVSPSIGTVSWNSSQNRFEWLGTLNPGQSVTITFTVQIRTVTSQPNGFTIGANVATRRINNQNDGTIPDTRTYTVGKVNLSSTKTSQAYDISGTSIARTNLYEGETIDFTITITNAGNEAGTIIVRDVLPNGLTIISSVDLTPTEITAIQSTGGLSVTVPAGGSKVIRFKAQVGNVATGTTMRNSVVVNGTTVQDSRTYTKSGSTYTLVKSSNQVNGLNVGDEIIYTIRVTLTQGNIARNVVIRDAIPTGTTVIDLMDATRIEGSDVVFEIGNITGNGTYVDVKFKVRVTVDNKNGTTTNQAQISNVALGTASNSQNAGSTSSNTVNILLEQYTTVTTTKRIYEERYEEILLEYVEIYIPGQTVSQNGSLYMEAYAPTNPPILICTITLDRETKFYKNMQITINNNTTQQITIGKIESIYATSAQLSNPQAAWNDSKNWPNMWTWYMDSTGLTPPAVGTYGGSGNDAFFIRLSNVVIHTDQYENVYSVAQIPVQANEFQVRITGTTMYGKSYSNTLTIPAGMNPSVIFANVPYGIYTIEELDTLGNLVSTYDVFIRMNNSGPPYNGYTPSPVINNVTVDGVNRTLYVNNVIPWTGTLGTDIISIMHSDPIISGFMIFTATEITEPEEMNDIQTGPEIRFQLGDGKTEITARGNETGILELKYCWTTENIEPSAGEWIKYEGATQYQGESRGVIYLWAKATNNDGSSIVSSKEYRPITVPKIESQMQFINEKPSFKILANGNSQDTLYLYKVNEGKWNSISKDKEEKIGTAGEGETKITAIAFDNAGRYSEEIEEILTVIVINKVPEEIKGNETPYDNTKEENEANSPEIIPEDVTIMEGELPELGINIIVIGMLAIAGVAMLAIVIIRKSRG